MTPERVILDLPLFSGASRIPPFDEAIQIKIFTTDIMIYRL